MMQTREVEVMQMDTKVMMSDVDKENMPNMPVMIFEKKSVQVDVEESVSESVGDLVDEYFEQFKELDEFEYQDFCIGDDDMEDRFLELDAAYLEYLDEDSDFEMMDDSAYEENSEDLEEMVKSYGLTHHSEAIGLVGRSQVLYEMVVDKISMAEGEDLRAYEVATMEIEKVHREIELCLRKFHQMCAPLDSLDVEIAAISFFRELLSRFVGTVMGVAEAFAECSENHEVSTSQIIGALEYFGLSLSLDKLADEEAIFFQFDFSQRAFRQLSSYVTEYPISHEAMNYLQLAFEDYLYSLTYHAIHLQKNYVYDITINTSDLHLVLQTWKNIPTTNNLVTRMGY